MCSKSASVNSIELSLGDLTVTIVNNEAVPPQHRAGYNGIARLVHKQQDSSIFVPLYAGFNLEHIFAGDSLTEIFEPRKHPMALSQTGDHKVLLHQSSTLLSKVESKTIFELVAPHYIDVAFEATLHDAAFFPHGYAGFFWASYIQRPEDKKIYFWGSSTDQPEPHWVAAYSERHALKSTHLPVADPHQLHFAENFNPTLLAHNYSDYRFIKPFYYGLFRNMVLIFMFDNDRDIRFSQSPTGGGALNPAWDFQFIVEPFTINQPYGFRARIVYKPFVNQDDVLAEYEKWQATLSQQQ